MRSPPLVRSLTLPTISALWLLPGCSAPGLILPRAHALARSEPAAPSVQRTEAYQQAARRFASGDYAGALAMVERLLAGSSLSSGDRAFLERQRKLCLTRIAGKPDDPAPANPKSAAASPTSTADCGPRALALAARRLGLILTAGRIGVQAGATERGTTMEGLAEAARDAGLKAEGVQVNRDALARLDRCAVAWVDGDHYIAVLEVRDGRATIHDPNHEKEEVIETEELLRRSGGILLTLEKD